MQIVLATRNPGKVREIERRLDGLPYRLMLPPAETPEVDEDAPTLIGNAAKKALALHAITNLPALADDTGLEVDALGGAPGVRSARFAGEAATDADNRALLRQRLTHAEDRRARFRTVLAFAEEGHITYFEGVCEGTLLLEERGQGGFGYDALFVPDGETQTFAEMPLDRKNHISHRGRALDSFVAYLRARASSPRPPHAP